MKNGTEGGRKGGRKKEKGSHVSLRSYQTFFTLHDFLNIYMCEIASRLQIEWFRKREWQTKKAKATNFNFLTSKTKT